MAFQVASSPHLSDRSALIPSSRGVLSETIAVTACARNAVIPTGNLFAALLGFYAGDVISNFIFGVAQAGVGAAPSGPIIGAFYSLDGTTLLGQTADFSQSAILTSVGVKSVPLVAPIAVPADGALYAAELKVGAFGTTDVGNISGSGSQPGPQGALNAVPACVQYTALAALPASLASLLTHTSQVCMYFGAS